jgi:hypothetical protein
MSEIELSCLYEALKSIPVQWRAEFVRFVEEGEANPDFLAVLEENFQLRHLCETVLRADSTVLELLNAAKFDTECQADTPLVFKVPNAG